MKQQTRKLRRLTFLGLLIALSLFALMILGADQLNRWSDQWPPLELLWLLLMWLLPTAILVMILGLIYGWRQSRNLRGLDPELPLEQVRSDSRLQGAGLFVYGDHLLSLQSPRVTGVDLRTVSSLGVYFSQEKSPLGLLIIHRPGHLPSDIQLFNETRSPDFRNELDSFLVKIREIYPQITLGPERIRLADGTLWKDLRFVTSLPVLIIIMILSPLMPLAREFPLLSLAMTLPAVVFWYRRFRLFRAIGRNLQFILEMSLFLGSLMLQGALMFRDPEGIYTWIIAPVMLVIHVRNLWLKYVVLPPGASERGN